MKRYTAVEGRSVVGNSANPPKLFVTSSCRLCIALICDPFVAMTPFLKRGGTPSVCHVPTFHRGEADRHTSHRKREATKVRYQVRCRNTAIAQGQTVCTVRLST